MTRINLKISEGPMWLNSIALPSDVHNQSVIKLTAVGDNNNEEVIVPATIMLASSPLIRSIISTGGHLPPSYQAPVLIIPSVSHDTLEKVSVILATGKLDVDLDTKVDVETALSLLDIDIGSYSYCRDDYNVNTELEDCNENINSDFLLDIRVKLEDMEAVDENYEESMNILINSVKSIHECNLCGKTYANKYGLYRHLKRFHDLVCSQCHKKFARKYNLMKHIEEVHKKSKIVSCRKCNKKFRNKYNLIRHIEEVHEKSKIVACTQCCKTFKNKYMLIRHMKTIHRMPKIMKYEVCDETFSTGRNSVKHIEEAHGMSKSVSCSQCVKMFRNVKSLLCHIRNYHKQNEEFSCDICYDGQVPRDAFIEHIEVKHRCQ